MGALPQENVQQLEWELTNDKLQLTDPLLSFSSRRLIRPRLLGNGDGGAVVAYSNGDQSVEKEGSEVAVKVSWQWTTESVERECKVMQLLERKKVEGVPRCLGMARYPQDKSRVMIATQPVVKDTVQSIEDIQANLQPNFVRSVVRTMVGMLAANVVTSDIQPLASKQTGDVLFIDLTEAQVMSTPPSFLDLAAASSFCAEMLSLIPAKFSYMVSTTLQTELEALDSRGLSLQSEVYDTLRGVFRKSQASLTGEPLVPNKSEGRVLSPQPSAFWLQGAAVFMPNWTLSQANAGVVAITIRALMGLCGALISAAFMMRQLRHKSQGKDMSLMLPKENVIRRLDA
eukprot:gnl/MRDRNA2_/MRDRNA2_162134_c0_seq1.p1 gnl/MRDRNA2_/MRDRNA2_162134_c0~~gnl/MRDRNA2_/MRDRNA2_162134_c0_seq1.p1  ORF type:complete len:392 (+),score=67.02 gnl/MRDRNA2_/MRDRNA2_162134_c0_seq1:149-1177(+)